MSSPTCRGQRETPQGISTTSRGPGGPERGWVLEGLERGGMRRRLGTRVEAHAHFEQWKVVHRIRYSDAAEEQRERSPICKRVRDFQSRSLRRFTDPLTPKRMW